MSGKAQKLNRSQVAGQFIIEKISNFTSTDVVFLETGLGKVHDNKIN